MLGNKTKSMNLVQCGLMTNLGLIIHHLKFLWRKKKRLPKPFPSELQSDAVFKKPFLFLLQRYNLPRRVNHQVQNYKTYLKNSHFGVEKFNFSLGLSFNFFCMDIILLSV
ncbi:hypothetical protein HMPREF9144_1245 [Prevotella pallens ATCC 700821]|uniref:Transposase DDE domain-containing protein n=2 Tax=Prevotella pallens TaxID=60133 RepID=A0ABX9DN96_9BACT|nr:hypothetical protein HMPREF9144_1245 [Prevotella pallens ATCC 700821]RAS42502.1 hypothetical protein BC673_1294 [Prevotella pallens]